MKRNEAIKLVVELEYVENQDYEGILMTFTKAIDGTVLDISGVTEITLKVYSLDGVTTLFSGTYTGGEILFVTNGTDGLAYYDTQVGDMDTPGRYKAEAHAVISEKNIKKQRCLIKIEPEAPS